MGARNREGIGLWCRPTRLRYIGWRNKFLGIDSWAPKKSLKIRALYSYDVTEGCFDFLFDARLLGREGNLEYWETKPWRAMAAWWIPVPYRPNQNLDDGLRSAVKRYLGYQNTVLKMAWVVAWRDSMVIKIMIMAWGPWVHWTPITITLWCVRGALNRYRFTLRVAYGVLWILVIKILMMLDGCCEYYISKFGDAWGVPWILIINIWWCVRGALNTDHKKLMTCEGSFAYRYWMSKSDDAWRVLWILIIKIWWCMRGALNTDLQ